MVDYPEPGDLVKTVVDLVTAANAGGGGGGGGFSDVFQTLWNGSPTAIPDGSNLVFTLSPSFGGGGFSRSHGTAISWGAGHPTRLTINTTGYYDLFGNLVLSKGSEDCTFTIGILVNGVQIATVQNGSQPLLASYSSQMTVSSQTSLLTYPLSAGDYVEFAGLQVGNSSADNTVQLVNVTARRVA